VAGLSITDRVRSSVTGRELGVESLLLHVERSQLRWFWHPNRMPLVHLRSSRHNPTGRRLPADPEHAGEIIFLIWPRNT